MKRTIALLMGLLLLITCVPVSALADTDVHPRLEVTLATGADAPQTLFEYGTDLVFNWQNNNLVVKLVDDTAENSGGTTLTLANAISAGKYVIMLGTTTYNPASGSQYAFTMTDLGSKPITIKYTYKPDGQTNNVTVTKDLTISVQKNILKDLTITGPTQKTYYTGEYLNLGGLTAQATYSNMTDLVTLDNSKLTITASADDGTAVIATTDPLTADQDQINVTYSETYPGSETVVSFTKTVPLVMKKAPVALTVLPTDVTMTLGVTAPVTLAATVTDDEFAALVATVDNPAVAAIDTSLLVSAGKVSVTALSVGTANVTLRTRGSNKSVTIPVLVKKAPVNALVVVVDKSSLSLPVNSSYSLIATISPDDTTDKSLTWTSSSPANVSVDSTGTVTVLRDFSGDTPTATNGITISPIDLTTRIVTIKVTAASGVFTTCAVSVNEIAVDGIAISDTNITLYKKSYKQLSAVVTPYNAADPSITWVSNNPSIATVDSNGVVTAVAIPDGATYGEAVITAQTSNSAVFATCTVKVLPSTLSTSVTLNKSTLSLNVGDEETLSATVLPSGATNKGLIWTSDNTDVATVSSSGKIIAASKGTAVIKAATTDGSLLYASCTVTVSNIQVLNISLDQTSLDLSEGDTASIKATIYPTNATNQTIKWTSSNTNVATVDSKGNIIAGGTQGYSIIRAAATDGSGRSAECVVLSKPKIHVTGITLNYGTTLDLLINDSTYLKATIIPSNASSTTVTWTSSNSAVASVDSNGLLKGVSTGEATITATVDGKSVTMKVTVTNTEYNYGVAANFKRRVNVRATASGLGKLVGYAYVGDTFHILGRTGSWYYIQYNNTTKGYIWASYLNATKTSSGYTSAGKGTSTGTTTGTTTTTPTTVTITNCLYAVNVRASASTSSTRIGKAPLAATYTYLATEGDWYKIQFNSTTIGYVYSTFGALS